MEDIQELFKDMITTFVNQGLEGELDEELGYSKYDFRNKDTDNSRNGHSEKTLKTSYGDVDILVPRDRKGELEPELVKKQQTTLTGDIEEKILSMYAKGMTTGDIEGHIKEIYGLDVSDSAISRITDKILPVVKELVNACVYRLPARGGHFFDTFDSRYCRVASRSRAERNCHERGSEGEVKMNRQYIRSERAHYMCPNMHFAIRFCTNKTFIPQIISQTLASFAVAHPFLRAQICHDEETDELYYQVTDESKIQYRPFSTEDEMMQAWTDIAGSEWNVFETGMLKVFSCLDKGGTMLLFAAHHLLTDGRGLLKLICEFADCIAEGKAPMLAEEHLIASIDDLPKGSELAFISRLLVDRAGRQWQKERHAVIYTDYLKFAAAYGRAHPVEYRRDQMDANEMAALCAKCHDAGVSINDWLMAQLYISERTNKIIIASDIRNELSCYHKGALGNYASAMSIVCRTKTTNPIDKAKEVHALMQQSLSSPKRKMMVLACYLRMNPKLLDATAISALGGFDSKAARFVGGSMFGLSRPTSYSITNLGKIENQHITFAEFIPPASPAACATLGVLTLNGVMRVVTSVYCE